MQFLPVAQRELAVAARRKSTAWARVASAGIALALAFAIILTVRPSRQVGPQLLTLLTLILFIEAMLAGVRYTSDCLSEEKREGTLGLLFLTNLTGFDVVAGKLAGRALAAVYNLAAAIPIFGLSVLFGGVTGGQIAALSGALVLAMFFSLALGMLVSSAGYRERNVLLGTLFATAGFAFLPPVVWQFERWTFQSGRIDWMLLLSPVYAFREANRGWNSELAGSSAVLGTITLLMFGIAAWRLRRSYAKEETVKRGKAAGGRFVSAVRRRRLLRENPIYWLAIRNRSRRLAVAFGLLAIAFGIFGRVALEMKNNLIPVVVFGSYGLHVFYKLLIVAESSRRFNEDKKSGALELLLTTQIPPSFIVSGQKMAAARLLRFGLGGLALMNLLWMTEKSFLRDMTLFIPCSIVLIFTDAIALRWWGMLEALQGRRYPATVIRAFNRVIGVPILILVLVFFAAAQGGLSNQGAQTLILLWTAACLIYDAVLSGKAARQLKDFRRLASEGSGSKPPRRPFRVRDVRAPEMASGGYA